MKVSVSLPDEDVEYLDAQVEGEAYGSRSAAMQAAIRLMRAIALADSYDEATREWDESDEADVWDVVVGDGLVR